MNIVDIHQMRLELQVSQEEFAKMIGVSIRTINRWESGEGKPSLLAWHRINQLIKQTQDLRNQL